MMQDDLIDDSGFELGLPSREEMLKHQCDLLGTELDTTRRDLRQAHKNLAGLICMSRNSSIELAALKVENQRITQRLSECYEADRKDTPTLRFAYGAYEKK